MTMTLDYAMERVTVACERLVDALAGIASLPGGTGNLNEGELACWDELRRAAGRGMQVFRVAPGMPPKPSGGYDGEDAAC